MQKKSASSSWLVVSLIALVLLAILASYLFYQNYLSSSTTSPQNSITSASPTTIPLTDAGRFAQDYPATPAENPFIYTTTDQMLQFINPANQNTGLIFFGFSSCPWCQKAVPVLSETATTNQIEKIYYYDPKEIRAQNSPAYQELINYLAPYLDTDEQNQPRLYVPDVFFLKDGQIVGHHLDTVESHTDSSQPLTAAQKQELSAIYQKLIDQIK